MSKRMYEYAIMVGGKRVLEGRNLKEMWGKAKKKYPHKKLSIRWEPPKEILIA